MAGLCPRTALRDKSSRGCVSGCVGCCIAAPLRSECLRASERAHADIDKVRQYTVPSPDPLPTQVVDEWRQLGCAYEFDAALEKLMDHPSVFPKVSYLLWHRARNASTLFAVH